MSSTQYKNKQQTDRTNVIIYILSSITEDDHSKTNIFYRITQDLPIYLLPTHY